MKDEPTHSGCLYKSDSDSVCKYLSEIVDNRDVSMSVQFETQNKIIRKHNTEVINLMTSQSSLMRETIAKVESVKTSITELEKNDTDKEKRLRILEKYAGWQDTGIRISIAVTLSIILVFVLFKFLG